MSRNRFIRWVALAGCSAVVGALGVVPGASAHTGSSHAPFTTQRVDLRSAAFQAGPSNVKVCFDQAIGAIASSASAQVQGYDDGRRFAWPGGVGTLDADPNCILLPVAPGTDAAPGAGPSDINNMTVFSNTQGFVTGTTGQANTDGAVALTGVNPAASRDHTDALELQSAAAVAPNAADYVFDRNLDEGPGAGGLNAADYGWQTSAGDTGTCIGSGGSTIAFGPANTARVTGGWAPVGATPAPTCIAGPVASGAVRFFADTTNPAVGAAAAGTRCATGTAYAASDRGTIRLTAAPDANTLINTLGVVGTGAAGSNAPGPTDDPDVTATATTKSGANTVNAQFDEAIVNTGATAPIAACFLGFEADGDIHAATGALVSNPTAGSNTVQLTFATLPTHQLQVLGILPGAVTSSVTAGEPNSYGIVEFSDRLESGYTDGGDLEQLTVNTAQQRATYCFDIDETLSAAIGVSPGSFQLLDQSGSVIGTGNTQISIVDNCTTIGFPAAVPMANAVAGGINTFAAFPTDDVGAQTTEASISPVAPGYADPGPNFTVGFSHVAVGGPVPTGAPPGPPTPTPPTPTPPGGTPTVSGNELCNKDRATANQPERIVGNAQDNRGCGYGGADLLALKAGNDTGLGGGGNDTGKMGPGNDLWRGGGGADTGRGGPGDDRCTSSKQEKSCA